jgi:hypothetical protein
MNRKTVRAHFWAAAQNWMLSSAHLHHHPKTPHTGRNQMRYTQCECEESYTSKFYPQTRSGELITETQKRKRYSDGDNSISR